MAGGLMSLASCTTETHESDMSQAQIDSAVNSRVEEIRMEMMRQNDSLINAMAQVKADSIIAAMKGGSSVTTKTTTTRTTTVKPKTSVTTSGNAASTGTKAATGTPAQTTSQSKWQTGGNKGTSSESKWNQGEKKEENTSQSKWGK